MKTTNNKKGFTIIEVVLVLAIAGLIFMMVFLALPALQRSQRDTARSTDMARVITALNNYQANNRGRLPSGISKGTTEGSGGDGVEGECTGDSCADETNKAIIGHTVPDMSVGKGGHSGTWLYFYDNYLIINSGGTTDTFLDPDGEPYSLALYDCKTADGIKENEECTTGQRYNVTFAAQSAGGNITGDTSDTRSLPSHSIAIVQHAACDGEIVRYAGARKIAVVYKKEGAGTICLTN